MSCQCIFNYTPKKVFSIQQSPTSVSSLDMKAIGLYLLVAVIPVLVNSCLVVKSPPCTCPITLLDRTNIDQMAGQSWYDYVVQRPLTTPTIRHFENNCGAFIQCPLPYTLYATEYFKLDDRFKPDLVGYCDQKTNTWNVTTWDRTYLATKWSLICVDEKELCTPKTNTTFLFAYSNDMDAAKVQEMVETMDFLRGAYESLRSPQFTTLAHIRFDVLQEETIEYHKDYEEWLTAIGSKLPDPSLSFTSTEAESDALKVISKFLNNTQVPICGSRIFILLKRSPNEQDITELVAQMRKYRVYVYIAASSPSSGGSHPETIRRLTTQTNGWDYYYKDSSFNPFVSHQMTVNIENVNNFQMNLLSPFFFNENLIYAANVNLSPNGSTSLPEMTVPRNGNISFLNYDNLMTQGLFLNVAVYDMQLDYEISDGIIYAAQIRIYNSG
ncbi:hypothetical protein CRE_03586 [Caenorhabditis remanei]|uniref:Uncharacterized protein n=1 Tax=Caenorhabditis remanei TaxID=31234 RepID=E3NUV2_CAERE|nr:hypothetical protein CRE_03586 [Caenorhabditis remanei]